MTRPFSKSLAFLFNTSQNRCLLFLNSNDGVCIPLHPELQHVAFDQKILLTSPSGCLCQGCCFKKNSNEPPVNTANAKHNTVFA